MLIELNWLRYLIETKTLAVEVVDEKKLFNDIEALKTVSDTDFQRIKEFEKTLRHDIKAVEYYIKERLENLGYSAAIRECVHFLCTSEDINNLAYSLMVKDFKDDILLKQIGNTIQELKTLAITYKNLPMIARTHGQPATPTTLGKELANFTYRLWRMSEKIRKQAFMGKMNGAVGNYNAHYVVDSKVNWIEKSKDFIENKLGLTFNYFSTQIEPHDTLAEFFTELSHLNTISIGMCQDMWQYISREYFKQKVKQGEVGSSIMPHKVNPIDFENAEGNLGLANSFLDFFSRKLPISRFQRDLSDSTVLRNIGVAMGHTMLAFKSIMRGLGRLEVNKAVIEKELDEHWEVLAEPIQQVLRQLGCQGAYESLKEFSRGRKIDKEGLQGFIEKLDIPEAQKQKLRELRPDTYIGVAGQLVDELDRIMGQSN